MGGDQKEAGRGEVVRSELTCPDTDGQVAVQITDGGTLNVAELEMLTGMFRPIQVYVRAKGRKVSEDMPATSMPYQGHILKGVLLDKPYGRPVVRSSSSIPSHAYLQDTHVLVLGFLLLYVLYVYSRTGTKTFWESTCRIPKRRPCTPRSCKAPQPYKGPSTQTNGMYLSNTITKIFDMYTTKYPIFGYFVGPFQQEMGLHIDSEARRANELREASGRGLRSIWMVDRARSFWKPCGYTCAFLNSYRGSYSVLFLKAQLGTWT